MGSADKSAAASGFVALGISDHTLNALDRMGYEEPTAVQRDTIPKSLAGQDLVVMSRTGTGKTAAFGIPMVETIDPERREVQALALAPTRELAVQVEKELSKIGAGKKLGTQCIYGGDSMGAQIDGIRSGVQIVAGTPGRVLDHLRRGTLCLDAVSLLVLDEADKMLDMGFAQEMAEIMEFIPEKHQTLLFSATIPTAIRGLIYHYLVDPEWILLSEDFAYVTAVRHAYVITPQMEKEQALYQLIEYDQPASSMIFCNTRSEVRGVAGFLVRKGLPVAMISSDLTQKRREQVMSQFRDGTIRHLVATDVAARGIDVEDLSHVFIFSTPGSPELYIHRAGRTGRKGKSGDVISLVAATDLVSFNRLAKRYHLELHEQSVPTDVAIRERRNDRILQRIEQASAKMPAFDIEELGSVVEALVVHPNRRQMLSYLIRNDFTRIEVVDDGNAELGDHVGQTRPLSQKQGSRRRSHSRRHGGAIKKKGPSKDD